MKKIISVFLSVIMLMSAFSVMTFADENCVHTTTNGQCSNCNAFIIEEGATLSLSINLAGYNIFDTEWTLEKGNASIVDSGSEILIMMGTFYQETEEWVIIEGVTVGTDTLWLYSSGSAYTSAQIAIVPHQTHTPKVIEGTATCTSPGLSDGEVCVYCEEVLIEQTEVEALGHTEVTISGYEATCSITGLTDGVICDNCGEIFIAQEEIPTTNHDYVMYDSMPATCIHSGYIAYECLNCGYYYENTEEPTGQHDYAVWDSWHATCGESGFIDYGCLYCSYFYTEIIEPTGQHDYVVWGSFPATCGESGFIDYGCLYCGYFYTEIIEPTGHTVETIIGYAPTCTQTGLTDGGKCSVCDEIITEQAEIPATGHTEEVIPGKDATYTETGLTEGKKCSVCDIILVEQTEIPVLEMPELKPNTENITVTETVANLAPEMSIDTFIASVENENVQILDKDGKEIAADEFVGTGNKIQVLDNDGNILSEYEVMVKSDIDGNGKVTPADARLALRAAAGLDTIEGVYETAANFDEQDVISPSDARMILRKAAGLE